MKIISPLNTIHQGKVTPNYKVSDFFLKYISLSTSVNKFNTFARQIQFSLKT